MSFVDTGATGIFSEMDSGRPPIVLLHGTAGSAATHFSYLLPLLATRHRVIALDFEQTKKAGDRLELDDLVQQVVDVIAQTVPGQPVALLGYSLGAVVAARTAAAHPHLVDRLILVAGWALTDSQQILRNDVWQDLRRTGSEAIRPYSVFCAFGGPFLATKTLAELEVVQSTLSFTDFGDQQMDLNRRIDIRDDVASVQAPTLVIGCTHDQMVPLRHSKYLFGAIEDARFAEIASGHAVVFERPAELLRYVDNFVQYAHRDPAGTIIEAVRP